MRAASLLLGLLAAAVAVAQQPAPVQMPPSEEMKAATAPFNAARAQPDDLTDADMLALGAGVARAGHACLALQPSSFTQQPDEILALARLCIFGRQFEPARASAVHYLELPAPPQRETAYLLLAQAYLGLKDPMNAARQVFSLEQNYPYDAQIHFCADQVILAAALLGDIPNSDTLQLCASQTKASLLLLEKGEGLPGKDASASPATLFSDAVRCLDIERALHDLSAPALFTQLQQVLQLPAWQGTAELAPMQSALARTAMVNGSTPLPALSGKLVRAAGPLVAHTVPLDRGTAMLIPFTLWAPSTLSAIRDFPPTAPRQAIYLVTSWSANTVSADQQSPEILAALRTFAQSLPAHVSVLVVPQAALDQFHADTFPAAIVLREGMVKANLPLVGEAEKRMTVLALGPLTTEPAAPRGERK